MFAFFTSVFFLFLFFTSLAHPITPSIRSATHRRYHDSISTVTRLANYSDVEASYKLVYTLSDNCPKTFAILGSNVDQREFPIVPPSAIREDSVLCSGDQPLNFVTEQTVTTPDLLNQLNLSSFQDALQKNPNANALVTAGNTKGLIVGWHAAELKCSSNSYPADTIYFIVRENDPIPITFSFRSDSKTDVLTIPPLLRSFLIIAPGNRICILADESTRTDKDITLTTTYTNGSSSTKPITADGVQQISDDTSANSAVAAPSAASAVNTTSSSSASAPTAAQASRTPLASASASPSSSASAPASTSAPAIVALQPESSSSANTVAISASSAPSAVITATASISPTASIGAGQETSSVQQNSSTADTARACFPASATVETWSGTVLMSDLDIGDRVKTGNGMSNVILFTHRQRWSKHAFVQLTTSSGRTLTLSGGHYLYRKNGELVSGASVQVGDQLQMEDSQENGIVVKAEIVYETGLYNPQTESGSIVVNGFVSSTYTTAVDPFIAHTVLMAPVRFLYGLWRWPVLKLSSSFDDGFVFDSWMPKGQQVVATL